MSTLQTSSDTPFIRVAPLSRWPEVDWRGIWEARELLTFLVWRRRSVRYRRTALGAGWAIIPPLTTMLVFTIFFGHVVKISSQGLPYPVFYLTALVPWNYFSRALGDAMDSLPSNQQLLNRVYFPRIILPLSSVLSQLIDLAIAMAMLIAVLLFYRIVPSWRLLFLPPFILLAIASSLGAGMWLGAVNVRFRDVRFAAASLIRSWMFVSPVVYPSSLVRGRWRILYEVNPMAGVIDGFRWVFTGVAAPSPLLLAISFMSGAILLACGFFYFHKLEGEFADEV